MRGCLDAWMSGCVDVVHAAAATAGAGPCEQRLLREVCPGQHCWNQWDSDARWPNSLNTDIKPYLKKHGPSKTHSKTIY